MHNAYISTRQLILDTGPNYILWRLVIQFNPG